VKTAISLTLIAITATLLPGSWLELQRGGALWRIATCHFTHFTYEQLAWDALVFLFLAIACERRNRGAFQATLLASVVIVPAAVLAFSNVMTYRGLSGIDSALFGLLLVSEWRRNGIVAICGVAFVAKMIFELSTGATVFVHSDAFTVVPVAHIAGALVGVSVAVCRSGFVARFVLRYRRLLRRLSGRNSETPHTRRGFSGCSKSICFHSTT